MSALQASKRQTKRSEINPLFCTLHKRALSQNSKSDYNKLASDSIIFQIGPDLQQLIPDQYYIATNKRNHTKGAKGKLCPTNCPPSHLEFIMPTSAMQECNWNHLGSCHRNLFTITIESTMIVNGAIPRFCILAFSSSKSNALLTDDYIGTHMAGRSMSY